MLSWDKNNREGITCPRVDTTFIVDTNVKLVISQVSVVRYRVDHEKIKFVSTSGRVIFCLLYKQQYPGNFSNFPKIFEHFPKIFENSLNTV